MITPNNAKYAEHISDNVLMNSKTLLPKAGTPLSALVSAIAGINETGTREELVSLSDSVNSSIGSHSEIQDNVAVEISKVISTIINVARNVVNPKIKEALAAIEDYKAVQAQNLVGAMPLVRQVELDGLFTDEMFISMVDIYSDSSVSYNADELHSALSPYYNTFTDEEIDALLKTGSSKVDSKAADFIGECKNSVNALSDVAGTPPEQMSLRTLTTVFLALTGIANGRVERLDGLADDINVLGFKAIVGRRLSQLIQRITVCVTNGDLILPPGIEQYDPQYEIVVIGRTYRDWIQAGGSPEAVMGYALKVRDSKTINAANAEGLKVNPAEFADIYTEHQRHMDTIRITKTVENVPRVVTEYLAMTILKSDDDDNLKADLQARLSAAVKSPYYGNSDVVHYVRDVVCAVYTAGDDVKAVLVEIDNVLQEHPDMDYAVYVAVNRVVARWIVSTMIDIGA